MPTQHSTRLRTLTNADLRLPSEAETTLYRIVQESQSGSAIGASLVAEVPLS